MAIAESCLAGGIGATLDAWPDEDRLLWLFGEAPGGGFVVSGAREAIDRLGERTPLTVFGTVGGDELRSRAAEPSAFEVSLEDLRAPPARLRRRSPSSCYAEPAVVVEQSTPRHVVDRETTFTVDAPVALMLGVCLTVSRRSV